MTTTDRILDHAATLGRGAALGVALATRNLRGTDAQYERAIRCALAAWRGPAACEGLSAWAVGLALDDVPPEDVRYILLRGAEIARA